MLFPFSISHSYILHNCYYYTELPVHFQRVIHNGRALNNTTDDMQKELKSFGLKSPVKILVVGKKPDEEDESYKMMKKWESSCDSSAQTLNTLQHDIEDMEKVNYFSTKKIF